MGLKLVKLVYSLILSPQTPWTTRRNKNYSINNLSSMFLTCVIQMLLVFINFDKQNNHVIIQRMNTFSHGTSVKVIDLSSKLLQNMGSFVG